MSYAIGTRRLQRHAAANARRRARTRGLLTATLSTLGCLILGVSAAGGTYAFLNDTDQLAGGTIRSGTAAIQVNSLDIAQLGARQVTPAAPAYVAFKVTNTGTIPLQLSGTITAPATPAIVANTRVLVVPVASAAACTSAIAGTRADLSTYATTLNMIAANTTQDYCLELSLAPNTPAAQASQGFAYSMTILGRQTAP